MKGTQPTEMDRLIKSLEDEKERLRAEIKAMRESEEHLTRVIHRYEETISDLIAEKEKEREQFDMERGIFHEELDQALQDFQKVETVYADFHTKFKQCLLVVEGFKRNDDKSESCLEERLAELARQDKKYQKLKSRAEDTLEKATKKIESLSRSQDAKVARLTAALKKAETKAASLQLVVGQQVKESEELTTICDEVIAQIIETCAHTEDNVLWET